MSFAFRTTFLLVFALFYSGALAAPVIIPAAPTFDASSHILVDFHSGAVLSEHNADERVDPASITKIMTTYVAFNALRDDRITPADQALVSEKAWRMIGSRMFIEVGKRVSVDDLLKGVIIQSGNDASVALAEHVAGTEQAFVALMNAQAKQLGMENTHYMNATGLPHPEHYTTARDTATLAAALIREFPKQYQRYSERRFTYNGITQYNRNKLLWQDDSVDGLKTGHTEAAGYCLASSAKREDMRLIATIMGAKSEQARTAHSQALLNYGFRFYETHRLYAAGKTLAEPRIWKGAITHLPLGLAQDLYVTIPQGQYDVLDASMQLDNQIEAPIAQGQVYGRVHVDLNGDTIKQQPLIALQAVEEGGLVRKAVDSMLQLFQ